MSATAPVHPEKILKELGKLWVDLGRSEEQGVLRACSMTLIVAATATCDEQELGETIAALVHEFPARAILVRVREGGDAALDARVLAQCWMPFGKRQQICCEQIELDAAPATLAEAAGVIRGLIVPDLPVVLYCADPRLTGLPEFAALLPLATKIVVDSTTAEDSAPVMRFLETSARSGIECADLAWARLTPWREAIAQMFDDAALRRSLFDIVDVRILYAHADEPAAAYYLAGWFMHVLGGEPHIYIARGVGPDYALIARVSLHGEHVEAWVELMEPRSIELRVNGVEQRRLFPECSAYRALREELSLAARDRLFRDVLGAAAMLRGLFQ